MQDTIRLLFEHMDLVRSIRQVGVARGRAFDQQVCRLTNELYLLLKLLEELLVTWKQVHVRTIIFSQRCSQQQKSPVRASYPSAAGNRIRNKHPCDDAPSS